MRPFLALLLLALLAACMGRGAETAPPGALALEHVALADLVVLGADPLADIGNLRRVEMVVSRGRLLRAAPRD